MTDAYEPTAACAAFNAQLADYLEGDLAGAARVTCDQHRAECAACDALVRELQDIVTNAAVLPPLTPSRDLWHDIAAQLPPQAADGNTRVTPITAFLPRAPRRAPTAWRAWAAAAALLLTVGAGAVWTVTDPFAQRDTPTDTQASAQQIAQDIAKPPTSSFADASETAVQGTVPDSDALQTTEVADSSTRTTPAPVQFAGATPRRVRGNRGVTNVASTSASAPAIAALDSVYGREIAILRTAAETNLGLLDSNTVAVVRNNLRIIDEAIRDSRRALDADPNSRLLLELLDSAYEQQVDLLRRLALL